MLRRGCAALWKFLNTSLGLWAFGTAIIGTLGYIYSERVQCVQVRDNDKLLDIRNQYEVRLMYGEFVRALARATTNKDIKNALLQLSLRRENYIYSSNKEKTDAQLLEEHFVISNRWGGTWPAYWKGETGEVIFRLKSDVLTFIRADDASQDSAFSPRARELADRAKGIPQSIASADKEELKPEFKEDPIAFFYSRHLWPEFSGTCDLWTVIKGGFRGVDPVERYPRN